MNGFRETLRRATDEMQHELTDEQLRCFDLFATELKKWNQRVNLTSITDNSEIAVKHIADSLFLARQLDGAERVLDVGSGAGIPAIPLKIARPDIHVVSVDAVGKKIQFQRHVARLLKLSGFEAIHSRIEHLSTARQGLFDAITSRAFTSVVEFAKQTCPLLADGGRLIAMKGPAVTSELEEARITLKSLEFEISSITHYRLPFDLGERCLVTMQRTKFLSGSGLE